VKQTGAKCWAAALSSWLNVVRKGEVPVTMDDLISVFKDFLVFGGSGGLRGDKINDVLTSGSVGMAWKIVPTGGLTHEFLARFLDGQDFFDSSHIYLIANFGGGNVSHARVLYRTVPYESLPGGGIWTMDPLMGYAFWKHEEAAKFKCLVGVRKEVIHTWMDGADWNS
jgi:hypothetical protein